MTRRGLCKPLIVISCITAGGIAAVVTLMALDPYVTRIAGHERQKEYLFWLFYCSLAIVLDGILGLLLVGIVALFLKRGAPEGTTQRQSPVPQRSIARWVTSFALIASGVGILVWPCFDENMRFGMLVAWLLGSAITGAGLLNPFRHPWWGAVAGLVLQIEAMCLFAATFHT